MVHRRWCIGTLEPDLMRINAMIDVTCSACGKSMRVDDAMAGKRGKCAQCGAVVTVPGLELAMAGPAAAKSGKPSATTRALAAAMAAMDAKESDRRDKHSTRTVRDKHSTRTVYDIGGSRKRPAQPKGTSVAKLPNAAAKKKLEFDLKLTPAQMKKFGGIAAGVLVIVAAYLLFFPSSFERENHDSLIQAKQQADRLASSGKKGEAYFKYQEILMSSAGKSIKSSELRRTLDEAKQARDEIYAVNRTAIAKARPANFTD
jgi:hypothetical protein